MAGWSGSLKAFNVCSRLAWLSVPSNLKNWNPSLSKIDPAKSNIPVNCENTTAFVPGSAFRSRFKCRINASSLAEDLKLFRRIWITRLLLPLGSLIRTFPPETFDLSSSASSFLAPAAAASEVVYSIKSFSVMGPCLQIGHSPLSPLSSRT